MLICHEAFAFGKGNMMSGVHEHLIKHLDWDGEGKLLDIGCGAAALTVQLRQSISKGTDHSDGSLGCGMELCKRAVREKMQRLKELQTILLFKKEMQQNWISLMRHLMQ